MEVPGHTLDHIAYYSAENGTLFCGDTLFVGGCGRVFEGTFPMMQQSLAKLSDLPSETKVYCTHEYTMANLNFARKVEPTNADLLAHIQTCEQRRDNDLPTVPSTIGQELLITHSHHRASTIGQERRRLRRLSEPKNQISRRSYQRSETPPPSFAQLKHANVK